MSKYISTYVYMYTICTCIFTQCAHVYVAADDQARICGANVAATKLEIQKPFKTFACRALQRMRKMFLPASYEFNLCRVLFFWGGLAREFKKLTLPRSARPGNV